MGILVAANPYVRREGLLYWASSARDVGWGAGRAGVYRINVGSLRSPRKPPDEDGRREAYPATKLTPSTQSTGRQNGKPFRWHW